MRYVDIGSDKNEENDGVQAMILRAGEERKKRRGRGKGGENENTDSLHFQEKSVTFSHDFKDAPIE